MLLFLLISLLSFAAAPVNDNCSNPQVITVPSNGYGLGTFKSIEVNIKEATKQIGESFAPAILVANQTDKSIWFKFTITTTRSVRVMLKQPSTAISPGDVGFTVYKTNKCLPTNADIGSKLTPIALFAETYHPCVEPGDYLVQVSAKNNVDGLLSIQLDIAESGALYDRPKDAQDFGKLTSPSNKSVDFKVDCQSLEDENEVCTVNGRKQLYTRSTWHTFTTPAYFDYLAIELAKEDYNTGREVVGLKLYKGNVKTAGMGGVTLVDDCDSLVLNQNYMGYKTYTCDELDRNTVYTIQLFYKQDFGRNVRLAIELAGGVPTKGPEGILSKIHADNKLGTLKADGNGQYTYLKDQLGCNSRHSVAPCNYNKSSTGVVYEGKKYNLSTFFTFNLATMSELNISPYTSSCGNSDFLYRVYNGYPSATCTDLDKSKLVAEFVSQQSISCLPAGNYTLQIFGRDSATNYPWYSYSSLGSDQKHCLLYHLGQEFQVQLRTRTVREASLFDLSNKDAFNKINAVGGLMKSLEYGKTYQALADTFGCENTVLPDGITCKPYYASDTATKAMYREFVVNDTGMVNFSDQNWYNLSYKLYKGDAATLATSQNSFSYPKKIKGLTEYTECITNNLGYPINVCLVPGTYTYVTTGYQEQIGQRDQPTLKFDLLETKHNTPSKAQNMGSLWDSVGNHTSGTLTSDVDYFSCRDNAVDINGVKPCIINGKTATKAIYRQFYLKEAAVVSIFNSQNVGYMKLFSGKATDGLSGLKPLGSPWDCFTYHATTDQCNPLPTGWYTIVTYGSGPTYEQPMKNLNELGYQSYVGVSHQFSISISKGCPDSKYNRPHKAAIDTITKKPFHIEWKARTGHTEAYPKTDTTYKLYQEDFNCKLDTPFLYVEPCDPSVTRVAYYVFQTTQESFLQINTFGHWASVYDKDIRKDSLSMKTSSPIQTCLNSSGQIQFCKLQPGTYTLVIFITNNYSCTNVTPTIYIDKVGYSRFDHASTAYDFGTIAPDSSWYNGKKGDVNTLNKDRAPSNDFFYCTTGSQKNDPADAACQVTYLPSIYQGGNNIVLYDKESYNNNSISIPRRNLWYTFVIDKPGFVHIKVTNKTIGKNNSYLHQYPFAVYKTNVDGTLPFTEVVSKGQVDSTYAQGLTFIKHNIVYSYCAGTEEISFYRDPCANSTERYYIVVDNRNPWAYANAHDMNPNSQVEVSILLDSVSAVMPKYDKYSQAYDFGSVGVGKHKGSTDNYSCATADDTDPIGNGYKYCAKKTLWYKFTSTITGHVRFRIKFGNEYKYYYPDIQLFREVIKGDSTNKGLEYQPYQSSIFSDGSSWSQNCISKGTYYLILTGCERINENVFPEIELIEQAGDYCSAPVTAKLTGIGSKEAKVIVDCHTIGTDYGEFGPKLTCPENAATNQYKSSWFRIDIEGKDTLDVTAFIVQNTNASSA
ncbi:MAG TPA: hypothetical protein VD794_01540, partial [Flavisolibacter sp.]|nr:hypothetical protein [Flavisolibacter sp.]